MLIVNITRSNRDKALMKHETLSPEEIPTPGTLVAIDAEFVSMQQASLPTPIASQSLTFK